MVAVVLDLVELSNFPCDLWSNNYVCNIRVQSMSVSMTFLHWLLWWWEFHGNVVHRNRSKVKYGNLRRWRMREWEWENGRMKEQEQEDKNVQTQYQLLFFKRTIVFVDPSQWERLKYTLCITTQRRRKLGCVCVWSAGQAFKTDFPSH